MSKSPDNDEDVDEAGGVFGSVEGTSGTWAGFLGETERGPTDPQLITSFGEFERVYGGYSDESYLAYAVDGFFQNGGKACFIGRVTDCNAIGDDNASASADIVDSDGTVIFTLRARGPGQWGNRIAVITEPATLNRRGFKLRIRYFEDLSFAADPASPTLQEVSDVNPTLEEVYDNLTDVESGRDYEPEINSRSHLVEVERKSAGIPDTASAKLTLLGGSDSLDDPELSDYIGNTDNYHRSGLAAFEEIDEIAIVCAPEEPLVDGLTDALVSHCEKLEDRFAILQVGKDVSEPGSFSPAVETSYGAFYYPWIEVTDPVTITHRLVPPGGHIAGIYARNDAQRGVHKPPTNEVVHGARGVQTNVNKQHQEWLKSRGINCIRRFSGRGILVWGARTTSSDPAFKYLNVRRLVTFVAEAIDEGIEWASFEPNDEQLWEKVHQEVSDFLMAVWSDGALVGATAEEAFYVECGPSTMTQTDIDNNRLILEVGIVPFYDNPISMTFTKQTGDMDA